MRTFVTRALALLSLVGLISCADVPTQLVSPDSPSDARGGIKGPPNKAPVASFTVACHSLTCTLDASASTDDHGIASYAWTLGQSPDSLATGKIVTTSYPQPGPRTVTLTVKDSAGLATRASKTFDVTAVPVDTTTPPDTTTSPDTTTTTPPPVPGTLGLGIATPAELPRVTPNFPYPVTSRVVRVPAGADLQSYLNAAQGGDLILLPPGAVFVGNFTLPAITSASSSAWIVVQTDVALRPAGTRMDPSTAASLNLAQIQSPNNGHALGTAPNAHHWRLTQLDIEATAGASETNGIVRFGENDATSVSMQATNLVLDRSYVHGNGPQPIRRCLVLNSGTAVVVDSWLSNCHSNNGDAQAIIGYNGPGPFLIKNNHLEGGAEVIMFGGVDPATPGLIPSDITVLNNTITRNIADKGVWLVKNLFELKNAQRVLLKGNVLESNWVDGQVGFALLIKSVNQSGGCSWCTSRDITVADNLIQYSGSGINLGGIQQAPAVASVRITILNNKIQNLGVTPYDGDGIPLQFLGNSLADVIVAHNTILQAPWGLAMFDGGVTSKLVFQDNVMWCGGYGLKGSNYATGMSTVAAYMPGYGWAANALVGCTDGYPSGATYFSSFGAVTGTGTDGLPLGASF